LIRIFLELKNLFFKGPLLLKIAIIMLKIYGPVWPVNIEAIIQERVGAVHASGGSITSVTQRVAFQSHTTLAG
jgi:hypothetical protein